MQNLLFDVVSYAFAQRLTTEQTTKHFSNKLSQMSNEEFITLLEVSGYIPDNYAPDSSEETLFSKLIEQLVCEWAIRIGFNESYLQTQKSSVEDITITDGDNVIVSDAKSFRLGRSQAAPNVKDVIKQGDYLKWILRYKNKNRKGGIITFPSKFEWKNSSDVHSYLTDNTNPILYVYYQHLSAMLKFSIDKFVVLEFFDNHKDYFPSIIPKSDNPKDYYFSVFEKHFFGNISNDYHAYMRQVSIKLDQVKKSSIERLDSQIAEIEHKIEVELSKYNSIDELKNFAFQMLKQERTKELSRIKNNIKRFR